MKNGCFALCVCVCVCAYAHTHTHVFCVPSHLIQMRNENDVIPCLILTCLSLDVYRVLIKLQLRCESLTSHRILCSATNLTWNSVNLKLCLHVLTTWVLSHLNLDLLIPKL